MFLGVILFLFLALSAIVLVMRAIRSVLRRLTGNRPVADKPEQLPRAAKDDKSAKNEPKRKISEEAETKEAEVIISTEDESLWQWHAEAQDRGISEHVWTGPTSFEFDTRKLSDICTTGGAISSLEFENRDLAGDDFHGFNIIMEEGSRLVLTCCGQAVASISKVETAATAVINGMEVTGTGTAYRTNTFPPSLSPGVTPSDLSKMLSARERIEACGGDPARVAEAMAQEFLERGNVSSLKRAVDGKIQARVSTQGLSRSNKVRTGPKRLS